MKRREELEQERERERQATQKQRREIRFPRYSSQVRSLLHPSNRSSAHAWVQAENSDADKWAEREEAAVSEEAACGEGFRDRKEGDD